MPDKASTSTDGDRYSSFVSADQLDKSDDGHVQATLSRYQGRFQCDVCGTVRHTYRGLEKHRAMVRHWGSSQ